MWVGIGLSVSVALAACVAGPAEGGAVKSSHVEVWATGDGARVNPETGRYFVDRTDIHKDYPTGDYRKRNAVWDAARGRVTLHAGRNEFVSFQVVVGSARPAAGIRVRLDELAGPGGARLSGRNVALLKAWYVRVEKPSNGYSRTSLGSGWYPDALLPAGEAGAVSLGIPDPNNHIGATQRNHAVWVDVYIPRDRAAAPPGEYAGTLTVSWDGGSREIDVRLGVWDFALPDEIHCRGDIWNGSLRGMEPQDERLWYQMARRHRFQPGVAYYRPKLTVEGGKVTIDWADYDRRLAGYLDGSAFTAKHGYWGPGRGVAIGHILLPFDCSHGRRQHGWPLAEPKAGRTGEFEAVWVETARQFRAHFDADPKKRKVRKVVFLGHLDESYNDAAYEKMIYYCKLLRKGFGEGWFDYRIDGGYSFAAMEKLHPYVGLWVCHTAGYDADKMAHFRKLGVEPWFYGPMVYERRGNSACGSNTFTDLDLLTCRGVGWAAWKLGSGYCQWEFDAFYDDERKLRRPTRPYEKAWTRAMNCRYGGKEFNGSGLLIYRGALVGSRAPLATIRLKAHRRGFQDYEYFRLLKQAGLGERADELVNGVCHTVPFGGRNYGNVNVWKHDPEAWDAVRIQAGKLLHEAASR